MSTTEQKGKKRWWSRRKRYGLIALIFIAVLLLNRCISSKPSSFSARPVYVPKGVVFQSVMIDGLDADFFYVPADGPRRALVLLGGSDGGRYWSYQPAFINDLIDQGFCV